MLLTFLRCIFFKIRHPRIPVGHAELSPDNETKSRRMMKRSRETFAFLTAGSCHVFHVYGFSTINLPAAYELRTQPEPTTPVNSEHHYIQKYAG